MAPLPSRQEAALVRNAFGVPRLWPSDKDAAAPTPTVYLGRDMAQEKAAKSLQREVTPQAFAYFQRIVKVTQSELEKLLVCKMQVLFDPVTGTVQPFAGSKENSQLVTRTNLRDTVGKEAYAKGQDFTHYLTGVLSRVLLDFARFAETILKWEKEDTLQDDESENYDDGDEVEQGESRLALEDLVSRLELYNQQNTKLEEKYNRIVAEFKESRRAALREKMLFKERLQIMKGLLTDAQWREYEEHDVQFFEDGSKSGEQELIDMYEKKLAALRAELASTKEDLGSKIRKLQGKNQELEAEKDFLIDQLKKLKLSLAKYESEEPREFRDAEVQVRPKRKVEDKEVECMLITADLIEAHRQSVQAKVDPEASPSKILSRQQLKSCTVSIPSAEGLEAGKPVSDDKPSEAELLRRQSEKNLLASQAEVTALQSRLLESQALVNELVGHIKKLSARVGKHCTLIAGMELAKPSPCGKEVDSAECAAQTDDADFSGGALQDAAHSRGSVQRSSSSRAGSPEPSPECPDSSGDCMVPEREYGTVDEETDEGLYIIGRRVALGWGIRDGVVRELLREGWHPKEPLTADEFEKALGVVGTSPFESRALFRLAGSGKSTATLAALFRHLHTAIFGDSHQFCGPPAETGGPQSTSGVRMAVARCPATRPRTHTQAKPRDLGPILRPNSAPAHAALPALCPPAIATRNNFGGGFVAAVPHSRPLSPVDVPEEPDATLGESEFVYEPSSQLDPAPEPSPDQTMVADLPAVISPSFTLPPGNVPQLEKPTFVQHRTLEEVGPRPKTPISCWVMGDVESEVSATAQQRLPKNKAPVAENIQALRPRPQRPRSAAEATMPQPAASRSASEATLPPPGVCTRPQRAQASAEGLQSVGSSSIVRTMSVPAFQIERPGEMGAGFGAPMRASAMRPGRNAIQQRAQRSRPGSAVLDQRPTTSGPPGAALRTRVLVGASSEVASRGSAETTAPVAARPSRYLPQGIMNSG